MPRSSGRFSALALVLFCIAVPPAPCGAEEYATATAAAHCLSKVTHINYESVAAIDMVEFFCRDGEIQTFDSDNSGHAEQDYAKHGRLEIPCSA